MRTIVWFRGNDLRVRDHEPLAAGAADGEVLPLFVIDPRVLSTDRAQQAPHRTQFLCDALADLDRNLRALGSRLVCAEGRVEDVIPKVAEAWKADRIFAYRSLMPEGRVEERGLDNGETLVRFFDGETLLPPSEVLTESGKPYAVFTPFSRAFRRVLPKISIRPAPKSLPAVGDVPGQRDIPTHSDLGLKPNPSVIAGGETAVRDRLRAFFVRGSNAYREKRDRMDFAGTSRLSADLGFGTVSVRDAWKLAGTRLAEESRTLFQTQLIWREFGYSILWHRPDMLERPFRDAFSRFPWTFDEGYWRAWTRGTTGYPVVDAAARQLLGEGFVHNRARMIAASFLTKHLLVHYGLGEAHYMKYLVDGSPALNNLGWQWSAGCGVDAQPYFRVFNPVRQGQRFDPDGDYVRRWVPELSRLPSGVIHNPWEAPDSVLAEAGVRLGETYPEPVVSHSEARKRFLDLAYRHIKGGAPVEDARRVRGTSS